MNQILLESEIYYKVQGNIALALGVITCLLILIPSIKRKKRTRRIIENGKRNRTFILADRISMDSYYDSSDEGGRGRYYKATYEYVLNGNRQRYKYIDTKFPQPQLPFYVDSNMNEAHTENELVKHTGLWSLPFVLGIIVGIGYFCLSSLFV